MVYTRDITRFIGDISQIGGARRYMLTDGKAKGVEAIDIDNGNGLVFTIVADRGLDIYHLRYRGIPISFISKTGIVSPFLQDNRRDEWLRSFTGGFLTTCGLSQVGDPCIYGKEEYGLHGLYSGIPAEDVNVVSDWQGDYYIMTVSGKVRQAKVQFEDLLLNRTIKAQLGMDALYIKDVVRNEGFSRQPFMILYHMNFGYPFLNPDSDIVIPSMEIRGWDSYSHQNLDKYRNIHEPDAKAPELTYYHDVYCSQDRMTGYLVTSGKGPDAIGVSVRYNKDVLNNLVQWKYLRPKDYVMALEPCNNQVKGIAYEDSNDTLRVLEPGEEVTISLEVRFLGCSKQIQQETEWLESLDRI